jgi:hypothetical protein
MTFLSKDKAERIINIGGVEYEISIKSGDALNGNKGEHVIALSIEVREGNRFEIQPVDFNNISKGFILATSGDDEIKAMKKSLIFFTKMLDEFCEEE